MKELKAQDPVQEKTKEKCSHPASISHCGWEVCVSCGLYLRRAKDLFQNDEHEYHDRYLFRDTTPDKTEKMKDILHEMITRVGISPSHLDNILDKCEKYVLPNEERCKGDGSIRIKVRMKTLCAVMIWEKVKKLDTKMSMVKFCDVQWLMYGFHLLGSLFYHHLPKVLFY